MKLRNRSSGPTKVEIPMAPMIDIVFQLLIFFMLNLKIVAPEGNFNINMPIGAPAAAAAEQNLPDIKVGIVSDRDEPGGWIGVRGDRGEDRGLGVGALVSRALTGVVIRPEAVNHDRGG